MRLSVLARALCGALLVSACGPPPPEGPLETYQLNITDLTVVRLSFSPGAEVRSDGAWATLKLPVEQNEADEIGIRIASDAAPERGWGLAQIGRWLADLPRKLWRGPAAPRLDYEYRASRVGDGAGHAYLSGEIQMDSARYQVYCVTKRYGTYWRELDWCAPYLGTLKVEKTW